jgi:hypothetical protein
MESARIYPYLDVAGVRGNDAHMAGEYPQHDQPPWASALAEAEQTAALALLEHLRQLVVFSSDPVAARTAAGVLAVVLAPDPDGILASIKQYPELLTDRGSALFHITVTFAQQLGMPRVIELVKSRQAMVQAIRETRG